MRALELGRNLADEQTFWQPARICALATGGVPLGSLGIAWLALLLAPWLSWKTPYWLRHSQLAPWLVLLIAGIAVPMFSAFLVMGCFFVTAVVMT